MYCVVYHLHVYLICNNKTRADIAFMRWWGQEGNVPNLGSTEQSTVALTEIILWDLGCRNKWTEWWHFFQSGL